MKNFPKKRGLFAVTAVLLTVVAILVTIGCGNDIGSGSDYTDDFTPPAGKGAVKLNFNEKIQRTILPDNATVADIDEYEFQFTPNPTGSVFTKPNIDPSDVSVPIVLDPGTYKLLVIAYMEFSGTMKPVAMCETSVTISAGKVVKEKIVLEVYEPKAGDTGTFSYTLSGIDDADINFGTNTATMMLTPIGVVGTAQSVNIKTQFTNTPYDISVATGMYYVDFAINLTGETANFRHIVHIYKNMTSSYDFAITLDYFNAVFILDDDIEIAPIEDEDIDVTYTVDGGSSTPYTIQFSVARGEPIVFTLVDASNYDSIEWYCLSTTALSTTGTCTINTTTGTFSRAKDYSLTVVVEVDSKYYAKIIEFSVTP